MYQGDTRLKQSSWAAESLESALHRSMGESSNGSSPPEPQRTREQVWHFSGPTNSMKTSNVQGRQTKQSHNTPASNPQNSLANTPQRKPTLALIGRHSLK